MSKPLYKIFLETTIGDEEKIKKIVNVAGGIIMKEGEKGETLFLVLQRAKDDHWPLHYEYPRGKCDGGEGKENKNEDLIACLKREIKEETGLDIIPLKLVDTFEYIADEGTRKSICYNYLCKIKDPDQKIKLSKEHEDYKWISTAGEIELLLAPEQKKTMLKVLSHNEKLINYPDNQFTKNNKIEEQDSLINFKNKIQKWFQEDIK